MSLTRDAKVCFFFMLVFILQHCLFNLKANAQNETFSIHADNGHPISFWFTGDEVDFRTALTQKFDWPNLCAHLQHGSISNTSLSISFFRDQIQELKNLRALKIGNGIGPGETEIELGSYEFLRTLTNLEHLELVAYRDGGSTKRADFTFLRDFKNLKSLELSDLLTGQDLEAVASCRQLNSVSMLGLVDISEKQMRLFTSLKKLKNADLGVIWISNASKIDLLIDSLSSLESLASLSLSCPLLNKKHVALLGNQSSLTSLRIGEISGVGLNQLKQLVNLERLEVALKASSSKTSLEFTRSMQSLTRLRLVTESSNMKIPLDELRDNDSIKVLDVGSTHILKEEDVAILNSMKKLEHVYVAKFSSPNLVDRVNANVTVTMPDRQNKGPRDRKQN